MDGTADRLLGRARQRDVQVAMGRDGTGALAWLQRSEWHGDADARVALRRAAGSSAPP